MAEPTKNAREIRGVLDGGVLQFQHGGKWIDAGGDADTWLVLLVCADSRDGAYRIKPGSPPAGVALPTGPRNGLAQIEGDSIVIRLTADACAFAFVNDPQAQEPRPPVIDKQAFLRDTFNALTAEGEDGSTPLTDVLDKAMVRAMEDGSDALDHDAAGVAPTHGGEHG
jgi:hypothetical protein